MAGEAPTAGGRTVEVVVLDAFTDEGAGGNPAGVVIDADGLSPRQMQEVARGVGVSETAFVSQSDLADFKLDFFTPTRRIAHCGHATIAAFSRLLKLGRIEGSASSKETVDGRREILVAGGVPFMEQSAPTYERVDERLARILASLGLAPSQLADGDRPLVASTGNRFLLVPLRDPAGLGAIRAVLPGVERLSDELDLVGFYPFCRQTRVQGRHAAARMLAPRYGIAEEAATGMAAGPLACHLRDHLGVRDTEILVEQGAHLDPPSPSLLTVRLTVEAGVIRRLFVGGRARVRSQREVRVPA